MSNNTNFKKICDKENMLLEHNKEMDIYSLNFTMINNNKNINNILDNNIYNLLKQINPEIIEDVVEIITNDDENIILFIFKEIGKEIGLKQKYMFLKNKKLIENNKIIYETNSVNKDDLLENGILNREVFEKISNLQCCYCDFAKLTIIIGEKNLVNIHYLFKININENLPNYMTHMIGMIMKKIFFNLKLFIEK
jgi:hypothetical protein